MSRAVRGTLDFEVVAAEETPLGLIWLRRCAAAAGPAGVVAEISLDHEFLMSSATTDSERALAARAISLHAGDRLHALVGGLGVGATAHELLRSPRIASVRVVELLQPILDWHAQDLIPRARELRADARFSVERGDVYARLLGEPGALHDLILVDVDHSPEERLGPTSEGFYGAAGLARARRHLAPGGILGVWSYAACPRFERELRAVFAEVRAERIAFTNALDGVRETNWLYFASG